MKLLNAVGGIVGKDLSPFPLSIFNNLFLSIPYINYLSIYLSIQLYIFDLYFYLSPTYLYSSPSLQAVSKKCIFCLCRRILLQAFYLFIYPIIFLFLSIYLTLSINISIYPNPTILSIFVYLSLKLSSTLGCKEEIYFVSVEEFIISLTFMH